MGFWKKVKESVIEPKKSDDVVYAKVNPDHPHAGLDLFSETNDFAVSVKITGVSVTDARTKLCGRVITWDEMTVKEREAVKSGRLSLNMDQFARHLK
jgi:hypothetical protein